MSGSILVTGLEIARIGADLLLQKRTDEAAAMTEIVGHVFDLVPVEELRKHLNEFDRVAIDAAADVAEEKALAERNEP